MKKILFKKSDNLGNDNNLLLQELPFYGIGGTICRIEEAEESYYKVLYNQDGSINPLKIPVPKKKKKNFKYLLDDYFKDLGNYLDMFKNKHIELETNTYKEVLTNKQFILLSTITFLASIFSIPFLFTTTIIGLIFSAVSILSLYIVCDIHKKDVQTINERNIFIDGYKKLEKDLKDYNAGKTNFKVKDKTMHQKIKKIDNSYLKPLNRIKNLVREIA